MARIAPLSGFPEWLPEQRIVEQHVVDTLREVFELHGFASIETRSVEPLFAEAMVVFTPLSIAAICYQHADPRPATEIRHARHRPTGGATRPAV